MTICRPGSNENSQTVVTSRRGWLVRADWYKNPSGRRVREVLNFFFVFASNEQSYNSKPNCLRGKARSSTSINSSSSSSGARSRLRIQGRVEAKVGRGAVVSFQCGRQRSKSTPTYFEVDVGLCKFACSGRPQLRNTTSSVP